jgi:serine/threonine protein kinase
VDGRFKVVRLLTVQGRHTSTYQATEAASGDHVTLREFRDDLRNEPAAKQELLEELRRIGALNLPGIPAVRGFLRHDDRSYLISPYVSGHTLGQILARQGRLTPDQALSMLRAVAAVLVGLHDVFPPQLHLDITPDTILLSGWSQAHLLDGAWLKDLGNPYPHRPALHQTDYAAPEALRGNAVPASDIYSLGLSVLEGVTGLPAPRLHNPFSNRVSWDALPHDGLNEVLVAMVDGSLASRLGTARELAEALDRIARGEPPLGKSTPAPAVARLAIAEHATGAEC